MSRRWRAGDDDDRGGPYEPRGLPAPSAPVEVCRCVDVEVPVG